MNQWKEADLLTIALTCCIIIFIKQAWRGGSYVGSPEWLKNKIATTDPKNKNYGNCFQYTLTAALNHQNIENNVQRISNIKTLIGQYHWKGTEFPLHQKDWKKFEQNNKAIALNILYVSYNTKEIRRTYISKRNSKCKVFKDNVIRENQVILLMIADGEKWHYLAVKNLPRLLRGITSNHNGNFYCLNCFHSFSTKRKTYKTWKSMLWSWSLSCRNP